MTFEEDIHESEWFSENDDVDFEKIEDMQTEEQPKTDTVDIDAPSTSSNQASQSSSEKTVSRQSSTVSNVSWESQLPVINHGLQMLGESPIPKKKVKFSSYVEQKSLKVSSTLKRLLAPGIQSSNELNFQKQHDDQYFQKLIAELKEKFHSSDIDRAHKLQILTLLPQEWGEDKISKVMETTLYMARASKKLYKSKGILSLPNQKLGNSISEEIKQVVIAFYNDERNVSTMPGKKDFVSVRGPDGKRTHYQKKLILSNLKELFVSFQKEHPDAKIGFSTFATLRPKHCVLAGASGTHTICVCSTHQNVKLMIAGSSMKNLTIDSTMPITDYQDSIATTVCTDANDDCYLDKCSKCPGTDLLSQFLTEIFADNQIEQVTYKQWITKPRTSLETFVKESSDFIDEFREKLDNLRRHAFISKKQGNFMKSLKESLQEGEFLVMMDSAENYAFVIQEAAPGFHWNNLQATIYTIVIYYAGGHKSLVIISDNINHDAVSVSIYTKIVVEYIKSFNNNVSKIYYFSDGAPQQYKNYKNIASLCHHKNDFGIEAEWHFFATAHGKGPCDGVGGTSKREAARASLQRPFDNQITTAKELFEWASEPTNLPNIEVRFSSDEFYKSDKSRIKERFSNVKKVKNIQKVHCLIPQNDGSVIVREYSQALISKTYQIL